MYLPSKIAETETPRTFTPDLRGFVAWLETQDPATEYNWGDTKRCLLRRFADAIGFSDQSYSAVLRRPLTLEGIAHSVPRTYGAALERARAALGVAP